MDRGVLQQVDTPKRIYEQPVNTFVAGFLGSPSMNFLDARLDTLGGQPVVSVSGGQHAIGGHTARISTGTRDVTLGV